MKKLLLILVVGFWMMQSYAQPTGYYNQTENLTGDDLKTALNNIIKDHVEFSYFAAKTIFKLSDVDPDNPDNVILVYTGRSEDNSNYGTGGNFVNREHVWAKSHGNFADVQPMFSDVHNLKPADGSVNTSRSNLDFDNGGNQHPEATGCYYDSDSWEPRDEVKGDIARIIFYMDTRYEGNNGELNLEAVDLVNTYPNAQHGKLSVLLEWNAFDPPDAFERNRNNVIFSWQKNRNPFIDNPEFADLIWNGANVSAISFLDFAINPSNPIEDEIVNLNVSISSTLGTISNASLFWGLNYDELTNEIPMTSGSNNEYSVEIPGQSGETTVFFKIVAEDGTNTISSITYNYYVAPVFSGEIISIYDIQGQVDDSPYVDQIVSTTGIVTANFGDNYFIQNGEGAWNGLFIYDPGRNPSIGDSIIVTGLIEEYYNKTELKEVSGYYFISSNNTLPQAAIINTNENSEEYESVLVKVINAVCTDDYYQSNHFMWKVDDGSGDMLVHNSSIFEYDPSEGESYDITGPLNYDFDEWKIELRFEDDVIIGSDITAPTISLIFIVNDTLIKLTFSEDVEEISAETSGNYSINNGVNVIEVNQHALQKSVVYITVSKIVDGDYILTINNVEDLVGNAMENVEIEFSYEGFGIENLNFVNAEVYPNPIKSILHCKFVSSENANLSINIIDLSGREIMKTSQNLVSGQNNFSIFLGDQKPGIYFLEMKTDNKVFRKKIMIE